MPNKLQLLKKKAIVTESFCVAEREISFPGKADDWRIYFLLLNEQWSLCYILDVCHGECLTF